MDDAAPAPLIAVDDSDDDRFVLARLLRQAACAHPVVFAMHGTGAIDILETMRESGLAPFACLLDIKMSGKNGFDVLEWIRAQPEFRSVPVALLSSSDEPKDIAHALQLGAQAYLRKHPSPAALRSLLAACERAQQSDDPAVPLPCEGNLLLGAYA